MLTYDPQHQVFLIDGRPISFSPEELAEMNSYEWWHSIPFSTDVQPNAFCQPIPFIGHYLLEKVDFKGKSVLDIGCWDGFQLFYAEAKGASRVVGVDDLSQRHMGSGARDFAKRKLQSKVEFVNMSVYDLSPENVGTFDIVMMFGVLYHLIHPMLGIEKACSVCQGEFLMATHFIDLEEEMPICLLYPGGELEGDHTNWTGASRSWLREALLIQGFRTAEENQYSADRITLYSRREENSHTRNTILNAHRDKTLLER